MNRKIKVKNEVVTVSQNPVTIHIDYNESLTLKELSKVLDLINLAINDVNRDKGIKNNAQLGNDRAAEVARVESGSIVLHIFTYFVAPIALGIFANFLYDRLKTLGAKKEKNQVKMDTAYPISINVNGDDNLIEVHITKPNNNDAA